MEHSDLKRGVDLSSIPIGVNPHEYKEFRPSPERRTAVVIRTGQGKGGEHEALRLRFADSVRLRQQGELAPAGGGTSAPSPTHD